MPKLRSVCVLTVVLALGAPGPAVAQNAGDEQYTDPLAPSQPQGGSGGGGGSGSGSPSAGGGSQGSAGDVQAAPPAQAQPAQGGGSEELPRTGLPAGVLALAGAGMVGAGLALRRRLA